MIVGQVNVWLHLTCEASRMGTSLHPRVVVLWNRSIGPQHMQPASQGARVPSKS